MSKPAETSCSTDAALSALLNNTFGFLTFIQNDSILGRQSKKHRISAETNWESSHFEWTYEIQIWCSIELETLHLLNKKSQLVSTCVGPENWSSFYYLTHRSRYMSSRAIRKCWQIIVKPVNLFNLSFTGLTVIHGDNVRVSKFWILLQKNCATAEKIFIFIRLQCFSCYRHRAVCWKHWRIIWRIWKARNFRLNRRFRGKILRQRINENVSSFFQVNKRNKIWRVSLEIWSSMIMTILKMFSKKKQKLWHNSIRLKWN